MTRQDVEDKIKNGESLCEADLSGLDLSGIQLEGADLEEANLESSNLSGANLSGASLVNANLGRADLSGAVLISSTFEGSNLRNADLSNADLTKSQFSEAYMGGATLVQITGVDTNFQGCYLGGADLSETQLVGANLVSANLEKTDLRNSHLQGCILDGANLLRAKVAGTTFEEIVGDGLGSQEMDFSPDGDGSEVRTFSAEELEKMIADSPPPQESALPGPPPPPVEITRPAAATGAGPEVQPTPETQPEAPFDPPPPEIRAPFEKNVTGKLGTPEIKLFIGKPVTEEGMSGIALYMIEVKELFADANITLKEFSNGQGECLLTFTTDSDANLFIAAFLLLHFFKFSYEVELKELYTLLEETSCVQPGEMEGMPILDFWALLPKFIKFPQAAFGFAEFKKEDFKHLEIILSTGQSINTFFHEGKLRIDYETVPYNIPVTINIKDQLLRPISHPKGTEIIELLHALHMAVGTEESIKPFYKETICFFLSRFINEIAQSPSPTNLTPAACHYWSLFWSQVRSQSAIAATALSISEYYPSLKIMMT